MTTFSRLVDDMVLELLRPDLLQTIATYANQTIRDIHFRPGSQSPVMYDANRYEETLTVANEGTWLWSLPSATRFIDVEAVYHNDYGIYIEKRGPKIALLSSFDPDAGIYWYRSGAQLAFFGVGSGQTMLMSYFMYPRTLGYKPSSSRVVTYDIDLDAYVLIAGGGTPSAAELDAETHWVLQRHADTVKEGIRAKVWKRLGEIERTRLAFSAFESMRTAIWNSEPSSGG